MKPEQQILNSILDYLAVRKIWHRRMNTGAIKVDKRFFRFGSVGMGDILATPIFSIRVPHMDFLDEGKLLHYPIPCWFEVKAPKGKQSDAQIEFQKEVEEHGHCYFVVRSIEDVETALNSLEAR